MTLKWLSGVSRCLLRVSIATMVLRPGRYRFFSTAALFRRNGSGYSCRCVTLIRSPGLGVIQRYFCLAAGVSVVAPRRLGDERNRTDVQGILKHEGISRMRSRREM